MNKLILDTIETFHINSKESWDLVEWLDKKWFEGWIKKSYQFFFFLNFVYLIVFTELNHKINYYPYKTLSGPTLTIFILNSSIPIINIFNFGLCLGEDINAYINKKNNEKNNLLQP
ncbi:MAG: hypothetical protein ACRCW9_06140 [Cetobacterium sp.]